MPRAGAPTGKWAATPPHLEGSDGPVDMSQADARLTVKRPNVPDVEIPLERTEFIIGRKASEVDLALDDEMVSRRHARLTMDSRGYFKLEDLGSRNGITYAGRTLRRLNLVDGDRFNIGKTEITFHADMARFKRAAAQPASRADSAFAEVLVPVPEPSPSSSDDS